MAWFCGRDKFSRPVFFSIFSFLLLRLAGEPLLLAAWFLLFGGFLFVRARDRSKQPGILAQQPPQPSLKKLQPEVVSRERLFQMMASLSLSTALQACLSIFFPFISPCILDADPQTVRSESRSLGVLLPFHHRTLPFASSFGSSRTSARIVAAHQSTRIGRAQQIALRPSSKPRTAPALPSWHPIGSTSLQHLPISATIHTSPYSLFQSRHASTSIPS